MIILFAIAIFVLLILGAVSFTAVPLFFGSRGRTENREHTFPGRRSLGKARALLIGAIALFTLGVGGGLYWMLGRPELALRTLQGKNVRDLNGLIGLLAKRVRAEPGNLAGWRLLGRAYLDAGDAGDSAKAFARAIAITRRAGHADPDLDAAYGMALVAQDAGAISTEAEAAFQAALGVDPKNQAARYYLGLADAMRGDKNGAHELWQSLLDDLPPSSPLHPVIVDRLARLGGAPPNINAMVAGLAARLKNAPNDPDGWQRLVRAYAVLGQNEKAKAALTDARAALAKNQSALDALSAEAKSLKLE